MFGKRLLAFICASVMMLTSIQCFAENGGVSGLTCTKGSGKVTLKWTNPSEFEKNILYAEKNGVSEEPAELGTASSYVYQPVADGDSLKFTIRTVYADESYADVTEKYFARYNDRTTLSGWTVSVFSTPDFGVSGAEAKTGNYSAYFNCENPLENGGNYYRLTKTAGVTAGKKYRLSFWYKTEGYADGSGFTYDDLTTSARPELVAGVDFANGKWNYCEQVYESNAAAVKNIAVTINAKGKIYFDEFRFEEIDADGNSLNIVAGDSFERELGVKDLKAVRENQSAVITWKNPSDSDFLYNEVYQILNGKTILLATLENGEEKYITDVTSGGRYVFVVKSCYDNGITGETRVNFFKKYYDSTSFPGWGIDVCDESAEFEITSEEKHSGEYSAVFKLNHDVQSNVYVLLSRAVSLEGGKRYCFSYWFKTEEYSKGRGRFIVYDHTKGAQNAVSCIGDQYTEGEWNNVKFYYDSNVAASKNIQIWVDSFGTIWLDDIEVYEVDENGEKIGENRVTGSDTKTDGGFELEAFSDKPQKPEVTAEGMFRGARLAWSTESDAEKVRIYSGETLVKETGYSLGQTEVDGLSYGTHKLDICNVSKYGVESDRVSVTVDTLAYNVSNAAFSQTSIAPGRLSASTKISNDGEADVNAAFILALYKGKKLVKMEYVKEAVAGGEEKELTLSVNIPAADWSEYSAAAYIWDDLLKAGRAYKNALFVK